jgi:hypothetical protein
MTPEELTKSLDSMLTDGPLMNIFDYMRARELYLTISDASDKINEARFGQFFGTVQQFAQHEMYISLSKMFDKSDKWSTPRSFPSILQIVEDNADSLKISVEHFIHVKQLNGEKKQFVKTETETGTVYTNKWIGVPSEPTIDVAKAMELVNSIRQGMPSPENAKKGHQLSVYWQTIKKVRNKLVAHNDHVEKVEGATLEAMDDLVQWCQAALEVLTRAIISGYALYSDDGKYFTGHDAKVPSLNMSRMLKKLSIV